MTMRRHRPRPPVRPAKPTRAERIAAIDRAMVSLLPVFEGGSYEGFVVNGDDDLDRLIALDRRTASQFRDRVFARPIISGEVPPGVEPPAGTLMLVRCYPGGWDRRIVQRAEGAADR